jgi:hypothetical protein
VQYKLGNIPTSLSHYEAVLAKELQHMNEDDISDLLTNVVACGANSVAEAERVARIVQKCSSKKSYEYLFNES